MRFFKALAAAAAFLSGAALAQGNMLGSSSSGDVIPNTDAATLAVAMQRLGAQTEIFNLSDGGQVLGVTMPSNARFLMYPTVCLDNGVRDCNGVSIQTGFDVPGQSVALANEFNGLGPIPKVVVRPNGVFMYHYLIADEGIIRANFEANIGVTEAAIRTYLQFLGSRSQAQSVSLVSLRETSAAAQLIIAPDDVHPVRWNKLTLKEQAYLNRP